MSTDQLPPGQSMLGTRTDERPTASTDGRPSDTVVGPEIPAVLRDLRIDPRPILTTLLLLGIVIFSWLAYTSRSDPDSTSSSDGLERLAVGLEEEASATSLDEPTAETDPAAPRASQGDGATGSRRSSGSDTPASTSNLVATRPGGTAVAPNSDAASSTTATTAPTTVTTVGPTTTRPASTEPATTTPPTTAPPTTAGPIAEPMCWVEIRKEVNLYPGPDGEKIGKVPPGDYSVFEVVRSKRTWLRLNTVNGQGWIREEGKLESHCGDH